MGAINKKAWRSIELTIMRYPEQKKKLNDMAEDIILGKSAAAGKTNFDSEYAKPQSVTESKALKLNSNKYYQRIKRNVSAIESVYSSFPVMAKKIIAERFWSIPDHRKPYTKIDVPYSEVQMKRIVKKMIHDVGVALGELENE